MNLFLRGAGDNGSWFVEHVFATQLLIWKSIL
jgi:hypothetical protein